MASSQTLTDHDAIREWAETHGAIPVAVSRGSTTVALANGQIPGGPLKKVGWAKFFKEFDKSRLALLIENNTNADEEDPWPTGSRLVPRSERRVRTGAARRRHAQGGQPIGNKSRTMAGKAKGGESGRRRSSTPRG